MAFRTFDVDFVNMTNSSMTVDSNLDHGIFTNSLRPPATIGPGARVHWRAESNGIFTGTEGHLRCRVVGTPVVVTFFWNVPAVGNSDYNLSLTDPGLNFDFFPRRFGFPIAITGAGVNGVHGLSAPGFHTTSGPVIPFLPGLMNPFPDLGIMVGLRDHREPVSVGRWLRALDMNPAAGIRPVAKQAQVPSVHVRAAIGPPPNWNAVVL